MCTIGEMMIDVKLEVTPPLPIPGIGDVTSSFTSTQKSWHTSTFPLDC